jgi:hypothetical protein
MLGTDNQPKWNKRAKKIRWMTSYFDKDKIELQKKCSIIIEFA